MAPSIMNRARNTEVRRTLPMGPPALTRRTSPAASSLLAPLRLLTRPSMAALQAPLACSGALRAAGRGGVAWWRGGQDPRAPSRSI
eukprot:scaffold1328_cov394-Prasinococcus_capsulatus_cf.AAC.44